MPGLQPPDPLGIFARPRPGLGRRLHGHRPLRAPNACTRRARIVNDKGETLGEPAGLVNYTIGQRKGLGIAAAEPLYVLGKDFAKGALVVGTKNELGSSELIAEKVSWLAGLAPESPFSAEVKIRYSAKKAPAKVIPLDGEGARVEFAQPLRDITPGQAAVFYVHGEVLGGGLIASEPFSVQKAEIFSSEAVPVHY